MGAIREDLPRCLGFTEAAAIVIGTVIGSGIFIVPNLVARHLPSPPMILGVWIFSGALSLFGALAYAELGAMMPSSGGQYAYLRAAFGPLPAFLCGWTFFLVVINAAIAWLATTFGIYLSYFVPLSGSFRVAAAISLILALSAINYGGVVAGARVQQVFTLAKAAGLILLVIAALASPVNHWNDTPPAGEFGAAGFGAAMIACLLTYDGWMALTLVAGEVKRPERNLPVALIAGIGVCTALYALANFAYLKVLPAAATAQAERVASEVAGISLGSGGSRIVTAIILVSIIGSANGWILAAPRLYFAQARDGLFFRRFGEVHPRFLTPGFSIVLQAAWAILLCVTGTYESLASLAMFAAWIFYGITVAGVFALRRKQPAAARPYRMWGYPYLAWLFVAVALGFVLNTYFTATGPALAATGIIAAGVPAYFAWRRFAPQ